MRIFIQYGDTVKFWILRVSYFETVDISWHIYYYTLYTDSIFIKTLAGAPRRACHGKMANVNSRSYICIQTLSR